MILDALAYIVLALLGAAVCFVIWDSILVRWMVFILVCLAAIAWACGRVM